MLFVKTISILKFQFVFYFNLYLHYVQTVGVMKNNDDNDDDDDHDDSNDEQLYQFRIPCMKAKIEKCMKAKIEKTRP